jgi:hypothetical protein
LKKFILELNDLELDTIYNALNDYQDVEQEEDDNISSTIMNKIYYMLENSDA